MKTVLAFDFGASSGRAIKAVFDGERISYDEIHRFENIPINEDGHIFHNVDMILNEIDIAIDKAGEVDTLAFDTWGVDYGLIDENGKLVNMPYVNKLASNSDISSEEKISLIKNIMNEEQVIKSSNKIISDVCVLLNARA